MDYSSTMYVNNQGRTIKHIALDTMLDVEQWCNNTSTDAAAD